jgi:hypothetical protein
MPRATTVLSVAQSRELIENTLRKWGVSGVSWSDDFDESAVILRFKWKDGDNNYVARFILQLPSDEDLRENSLDGRSGRFSSKKFERLCADRGKRQHYTLAMFIKTNFEAVEEGIITAQQVFLPWLEDKDGITVAERLGPMLHQLPKSSLPKMLEEAK